MADHLTDMGLFLIGDQGIQGKMHRHTPDMAVFYCLHQGLGGKILRRLAGIKAAAAQLHRVGSVLNGGAEGFHGSCRCQ